MCTSSHFKAITSDLRLPARSRFSCRRLFLVHGKLENLRLAQKGGRAGGSVSAARTAARKSASEKNAAATRRAKAVVPAIDHRPGGGMDLGDHELTTFARMASPYRAAHGLSVVLSLAPIVIDEEIARVLAIRGTARISPWLWRKKVKRLQKIVL